MALARLNMPGRRALRRIDCARVSSTAARSPIQDVFEAVGAHAAGRMSDSDFKLLEDVACPGAGACGGQFTANTMAIVCETLGIAVLGSGSVPATDPREGAGRPRGRRADRQARRSTGASRATSSRGRRSRTRSPSSRRPADRPTRCCTCWRSRTKRASTLDAGRFRSHQRADAAHRRSEAVGPLRRDRPARGRRQSARREAADRGGQRRRRRADGHRPHAGRGSGAARSKRPGQEVVRPNDRPLKPHGGLVILFGNLAPEGAVLKLSGTERADASRAGARVRQRRAVRSTRCSVRRSSRATSS